MKKTAQLALLVFAFAASSSLAWAQVPNRESDVHACAAKYPEAFACAHSGRPCSTDFVILCARDLGDGWGVNGKRGNPRDLSQDILAFRDGGTAVDVTRGNAPMEIVDICGGCGAPGQRVVWSPGPGGPGDRGAWVDPFSVQPSSGAGGPGPAPFPSAGWEARHSDVLMRLAAQGVNHNGLSTRRAAEQFAFSFPGEGWGMKSADPSRPASHDVLARQLNGSLVGYRIVPPARNPPLFNLTGQHFIPVAPVNHVGDVPSGPSPVPVPPLPIPTPVPPATAHGDVLQAIAQLRTLVTELHQKMDRQDLALRDAVATAEMAAQSAAAAAGTQQDTRNRIEDVLTAVDLARQALENPPTYSGPAKFSGTLTLRPKR
ncbi:MAG TPA: hypothetical protein VNJ02_10505 [Vicinamibacterales bacterium]|nr:hypothetical protein [Vicinamibacterales bacterium]